MATLDESTDAYPWTQEQCRYAAAGQGNQQAWLLDLAGDIVGFIVISRVLDELTILRIAVHADCQRRGYATYMLAELFDQLPPPAVSIALLEVRESNTVARCFYERCGFELDGIRKNYYPTDQGREDAVLLSRRV